MKGYKARTELRMYMPGKPEKFGIKFWARCDGSTAYTSDFELYSGKRDRTPVQQLHGLGYRVIHDLTRDLKAPSATFEAKINIKFLVFFTRSIFQ